MRKKLVNNELLIVEINKSLDNLKNGVPKEKALTTKALELLLFHAKKTLKTMYYNKQEDYKDCVQFAMEDVLKYWDRFDPEHSTKSGKKLNAFAYFTSIIFTGGCKGWNKLYPKKCKNTISLNSNYDSEGIYTL